MKLVNIMQCTNLGGMEWSSLRLMVGLIGRGWEIRLISLNPLGDLKNELDNAGIPSVGLDYNRKHPLSTAFSQRKFFRAIEKDEFVVMTGQNVIASAMLDPSAKARSILMMHFHHKDVHHPLLWRLHYQLASRRFKLITFPSDFVRKEAVSLAPEIEPFARVLRNPLTPPEPRTASAIQESRERWAIPFDAVVVSNAGWLIQRKRFDVFLNTAKLITQRVRNVHFVIAGDGPLRTKLGELAEDLGLSKQVHFVGWQKTMDGFYNATDVLLYNSDYEAYGVTALEALVRGIPVVGSCVHGGFSEMFDQSYPLQPLSHHSPSELARLVDVALTLSPQLKIDTAARLLAASSPEAIGRQFEQYLLEASAPP